MVCICYLNHEISGFVQELKKAQLASPRATDKVKTPKSVTNTSCNTAWPKQDHCCQTNAAEIRGQTSIGVQHSRHAFKSEYSNTPRPDLDLPSRRKKMEISVDISVEVKPDSPAPTIVNENLRLKEAARTETPRIVSVRSLPREQSEYKDFSAVFVETEEVRELGSGLDSISRSVETLPHLKSGGTPRAGRPDRPATVNWRTAKTKLALVVPKKIAPKQDAPSKAVSPKAVSLKTAAPKATSLGNQKIRDAQRDSVGNILPMKMSYKDFSALFAEAEEARELESGLETIFQDMETLPHLKSGGNPGARRPGSPGRPSKANWQTAKTKLALVVPKKTAPKQISPSKAVSPKAVSLKTAAPKATSLGNQKIRDAQRDSVGNILPMKMSYKDFSALSAEAEEARELESGLESIFQDMETLPHLKSGGNPGARRPGSPGRPSKANWQTAKTKLTLVVTPKTAPLKPTLLETTPPKAMSPKAVTPKATPPKLSQKSVYAAPPATDKPCKDDVTSAWDRLRQHVVADADVRGYMYVPPLKNPPVKEEVLHKVLSVSSGTMSSTSSGSDKMTKSAISKRKSLVQQAKKKGKNLKKTISKVFSSKMEVKDSRVELIDSSIRLEKFEINRRTMSAWYKNRKSVQEFAQISKSKSRSSTILTSSEGACKSAKAGDTDGSISTDFKLVAEGDLKPISKFKEMKNKVKQLLKMKKPKDVASTSKKKSEKEISVSASEIPLTMSEIPLTTSEIIRSDIAAINKTQSKALAMKADEIPSDVPIRFISVHERKQTMDTEMRNADLKGSVGVSMKHEGSLTPIISSKSSNEKVSVVRVKKVKSEAIKEDVSVPVSTSEIPLTMSEIPLTLSEIIRRDIEAINKTQRKALAMKVDEIPSDVPIRFMSVHERRHTMDIELEKADLKGSVGVSMEHEGLLTPIISRKSCDEKVSVVSVRKVKSEAIKEDVSVPVTIIRNPPAPASSKTQWIQSPPAPTSGKAEATVLVADEIPPEVPINFSSVKKIQMQIEQVKAAIEVKQTARQRLMEKMPELNLSSEQEISSLVAQKRTVMDKHFASKRRGSMSPDILEQVKCISIPSAINTTQGCVSKMRKDMEDKLLSETKNVASEVLKNVECQKVKKTARQRLMEKMPELNLTYENEFSAPVVIRHSPSLTSGKTIADKPVLVGDTIPPEVPINLSSVKERKKQMGQENACLEVTSAVVIDHEARKQSLADLNELLRVSSTRVTANDLLRVSHSTVAANEILRVLSSRITPDDLSRVSSSTSMPPAKENIFRSVTPKRTEKTVPMTVDMATDANIVPLVDRGTHAPPTASIKSQGVQVLVVDDIPPVVPINFSSVKQRQQTMEQEKAKGYGAARTMNQTAISSVIEKSLKMEKLGRKQSLTNQILSALNLPISGNNTSDGDTKKVSVAQMEKPLHSKRRGSITPDVLEQIHCLSLKPGNERKKISHDKNRRKIEEKMVSSKLLASEAVEKTAKKRLQEKMPHLNFSSEDDTPSCHDEELQDPVHQEMGKERLDSERRGSVTPDVLEQIRRLSIKPGKKQSLTNQILSALDLPISGNNTSDEDQMSQVSVTQKQDQMLSVSGDTLLVQLSGKIITEDDTIEVSVAHIEKPLDSKRRGSITPDVLEQIHRLSLKPPKERKKISHDKNRREMEERMVSSKLLASEAVEKTAKQRLQEKMPHLNFSSEDDTPSCHDEELQDPVHQEMGKENGYATFSSIKQLPKDVKRSVRQLQQETILDVASGDESGSLCSEISAPAFVPPEPTSGKTKAEITFLLADEISPEAPIGFISIEELQKKLEREKAGGGEMIKKLNQTDFSSVEKKRFNMEDQDLVNRSVTSGEKTSDKEINQTAVKQKRDQMLSVLGHKLPQLSGKVIVEDDTKEISVAQKRVAMEKRLYPERRGSVTPDVLEQIRRLSIKPDNETKTISVNIKQINIGERLELKPINSKEIKKTAKQRLQEKMPHLNFSSDEETAVSHAGEPPVPVEEEAEKAQGLALVPPEPTSENTKAERTFLLADEIPPEAPIGFVSIKQLQEKLEREKASRHGMIKRISQTAFSSVEKKRLDMEELANRSVTSGEKTSDKEISQAAVKQKRDQMLSVLGHKLPQFSGKAIVKDDTKEVSVAQKRRAMEKRLDSERRGSVTPDVLKQIRRVSKKPANKTKSSSVDIKRRDKEERLELKTSNEIEKTAKQRLQEKMPHLNFSSDEETSLSHDGEPQLPVQQGAEKSQGFALVPPEPTSETTKAERTFLVADEIPPEAPIGFRSIKQLQENLGREGASRHGMTKRMSQTAFSSVEKKRLDMEELANRSVTSGEKTSDKEMSQAAVKQKRDQMLSVLGHKLPQFSGKVITEDETKEVSVAQKRRAIEKRLDSERRGSVTSDVLEQIRRLSIKPANETKSVSVDIKQRNIGERLELKPINSKELEKTAKQRLQEKMPHLNFSSKDETSVSHDKELQVAEQQEAEKAQGSTFVPPAPKSGKTKAERTFLVADEIPPEAPIGFLSIKQLQEKLERERASGRGMIKRISLTAFSSVEKKRLDMEELVNRSVTSGENTSDKEMSQAAVKQKRDQMLSVLGHKLPQLSGKVIAEDDTKEVSVAQKRRAMEKRLDSERRGSVTSDVLEQIRRLSIKPANETKSVSVDIKQRNIGELKPINSKEIEKTAKQRLQEKMPHLNFSSEDDTSVRHDKELQVPVQKEAEKAQGSTFGPPAPKSGKTKADRTFLVADEIPPEDHIGFLSIKDLQEKLERERVAGRGMKKRISQTTFSSVEQKRLEMEELAKRLHTSEENTSDEEMSQVAVKHKRIQIKLMSVLGAKLPISGQALAEDEIKHVSVKEKRLVMQSCSASHRRGSLTPDLLLAITNFSKIKESETKNVSVAQKSKAMQDCSASHRRGSLTPDLLLAINNFSKIKESETKNVSVAQKSKAMQDCSASHRRGSLTPDLLLAIKNLSKIKESETKDVSVAQQRGVMEKRLASERRCSMSPDILEQIKRMSITSAIDTTIYGFVSKRRPEMDDTLVSETKYLASEALAKVDCKNVKKTAHQRLMEKMPKLNLSLEDAISAPANIRQSSLSGKTKAAKPVLIADEIPPKVPIDFISIKERQQKLEQDSNAQRGIKKKKSQTAFPSVNDKCLQMEKRGKKQSLTKQILSALNLPFSRENASDEEMSQVSVKQKRDQMLSVLGDTQPAQFSEKVIAETDTKKVSVAEKRTAMEKRLDFERSRSITPDILEQIQRLSRKCGNVENTAKQYLQEKMSHLNFSSEDETSASHDKELPVLGKDKSSCVSSSSVQQKSVALQPGKQLDEMPQKMARKRLLEKMPHLKLSSEKEISDEQNLSSNEKHGLLTPDILKNLRDLSVNPEALQLSYAERNGENKKMPHLNLSYEKEFSAEQNLSSNEKRGLLTPDMLKNLRDLSVNPNALQLSYAERNGGNENPSACKTTSERYDSLTSVSQLNSERCGSITPDILEGIERLSIASDIQPPTVCSSSSSSDLPAPPSPNLSLLFTPEGSLYSDSEEEHYCEHGDLFSDEDEMEPPAPLTPRTVAKANVDDPPDHWLQLTPSRMLTPEMDPPSPPELTPSTSFCKFDSEDLPPMPCVEEPKLVKKTSRTGKSPLKKSLKEVSLDLEMRLMAPPPEIVADSISQARSRYSSVRLKSEAAVAGKEPKVVVVGSVNDKKKTMEHFIMKGFAKSKKHGRKGENPNKKDDSSPESSPRGSSNLKLRTSSRQYSECSGAVQYCESCGRIYEDCRDEKNKKKRRKKCLSCCSSSAAENP